MLRRKTMDMVNGPILKNLFLFALPIMAINILQVLFHATDIAVLGIFSSDSAVAGTGATSPVVNLFLGFFGGFASGTNVLVGRAIGRNDKESVKRHIGVSLVFGVLFGFVLMVIVLIGARYFLILMNCPESILDLAVVYLRIYFLGVPIILFYNICAAIMRSVGDTVRPFIYLIIGGVTNLILNVFFVVVLKIDVAGVALATVLSKVLTAGLSLKALLKGIGDAKIEKRHLRIYKEELKELLALGIPAGIQTGLFNITNIYLNAILNGFGEVIMTANTVCYQFDSMITSAMTGFSLGALSFFSQNMGAKEYGRVWKVLIYSVAINFVVGILLGGVLFFFGKYAFAFLTDNPVVIEYTEVRLKVIVLTYCLLGVMGVLENLIKAMKKAITSMLCSILGTIVLSVAWMLFIFPINPTLEMYYSVYPVSWVVSCIMFACIGFVLLIKLQKTKKQEELEKVA
ncbi:MAG: MATE family efflux transporter [Clostridia bacterium]|nr:MATE family efflux transporter [Clostridia bacterium]